MKTLYTTLIFALVLSISGSLSATTITWLGGTGNWDGPANWYPFQVPGYNDVVVINSGHVFTGINARANRIELNGGTLTTNGMLNIRPTIANSSGNIHGINIAQGATFINEGQTLFYGTGSPSGNKRFIFNDGTFLNQSDGFIGMRGSAFTGIHNYFCNSFINYGIIEMDPVNSGIYSICDTYNYGQIIITTPGNALSVHNLFYNGSSGLVQSNSRISTGSSSFLNNYGDILLESGSTNIPLINVGETMINQSSGSIHIYGLFNEAIYVSELAECRNYGEIEMTSTATYSSEIINQGLFVNHQSGTITSSTHFGIGNVGDCRNFGVWHVNNKPGGSYSSINNYGVFSNRPDGKLYIQNILWLEPGSTLNNQGHMFLTTDATQDIINGTFNNTGSLNDVYGTLPSINNQSIIARPISGTIQNNVPIPNALLKGNSPGATVLTWYTTPTGNVSAGSYNNSSNVFTPNSNAIGLSSLFVKTSINTGGNTARHEVRFENPILPFVVFEEDDTVIELLITAFPNPTTEVLNIEMRNSDYEEIYTVRLTNTLGQTVAFINCIGQCQMAIPDHLVSGIYFLAVEKNGMPVAASKQIRIIR